MEKNLSGDKYIPYEEREGEESIVYFTRDLSAKGLEKVYEKVNQNIDGKIAIKLHTGEKNGPNIIPRDWVKEFIDYEKLNATIVETNTYYKGDRYTTKDHLETIKVNGWDFSPVDIMDSEGVTKLPVKNGNHFTYMSVGSHMTNYDSMITLTHFKGHAMGGFGGSNKNLGIGCADGRIGKAMIHTTPNQDNMWDIDKEELMEKITESTKATIDYFKDKITYINVMRNMSVSCDCEGVDALPVVTPNVGILASRDICAIDTACIDLIYAMKSEENHDFIKRVESRHGIRQLTYMQEMKMGNMKYKLIDVDTNTEISLSSAVKNLKPFVNVK